MRVVAHIILCAIAAIFGLAILLPLHLHIRDAIVDMTAAIGVITSLCQIVSHNTGYPRDDWCLPIGVPTGAVVGTVEYLAIRARRRGTWDVMGDLRYRWERIYGEMSTEGPKTWCEMTGGRWLEEEEGKEEEAVGLDEL